MARQQTNNVNNNHDESIRSQRPTVDGKNHVFFVYQACQTIFLQIDKDKVKRKIPGPIGPHRPIDKTQPIPAGVGEAMAITDGQETVEPTLPTD